MIISRTPYRVSFFGGGTDYHRWYQAHSGAVLSTTINHYCYLSCRYLPPFFPNTHRVMWRQIEEVNDIADIQHPVVRAALDYLAIERGVEVSYQGDLPARSGLGSSSAFTVGFLNALYALRGEMSSKLQLACEAVHLERDILKENVGVQDQIATAYGGLNKITFLQNGEFIVEPVILPAARKEALEGQLMMFFTGVSRSASAVAAEQVQSIGSKEKELHAMRAMVDEALGILSSGQDLQDFGRLLHESWMLKKSLASAIAPSFVDDIYDRARAAGAVGGKLLGAGGGGFMLFFVPQEKRQAVLEALDDLLVVPFSFENAGSQIIFYDRPTYSQTSMTRRDYQHLRSAAAPAGVIAPRRDRPEKLSLAS